MYVNINLHSIQYTLVNNNCTVANIVHFHHNSAYFLFLISGTIALLWAIIWFLLVPNKPPPSYSQSIMRPIAKENRIQPKIVKSACIKDKKVMNSFKVRITHN